MTAAPAADPATGAPGRVRASYRSRMDGPGGSRGGLAHGDGRSGDGRSGDGHSGDGPRGDGAPEGGVYEWFHRATDLLERGDAAAAVVLLERAGAAEPRSASVLEALGRAQYQARRRDEAAATFERLVEMTPDADYAHFGLGLALARLGRFHDAAEHLAMAAAMRPDRAEYVENLRQVRATLRAREGAEGA